MKKKQRQTAAGGRGRRGDREGQLGRGKGGRGKESGKKRANSSAARKEEVATLRGWERDREGVDVQEPHREIAGGVRADRGANHSRQPANNLLVFHVRFDSLSFRYLYLPGPLRISGICPRGVECL